MRVNKLLIYIGFSNGLCKSRADQIRLNVKQLIDCISNYLDNEVSCIFIITSKEILQGMVIRVANNSKVFNYTK